MNAYLPSLHRIPALAYWRALTEQAVPQYPLDSYGVLTILSKSDNPDTDYTEDTEELIVGGYACHDTETQAFTREGWKSHSEIMPGDEVATATLDGTFLWDVVQQVHDYDYKGIMHCLTHRRANLCATPSHRQPFRQTSSDPFELRPLATMPKSLGQTLSHVESAGDEVETYIVRERVFLHGIGHRSVSYQEALTFKMDDWLEFLGYYISEGWLMKKGVGVSQSKEQNPETYEKIKACIGRMGLALHEWGNGFVVLSSQLRDLLRPLGKSHEKYIPSDVKELAPRQLRILLDALLAGDGTDKRAHVTSSPRPTQQGSWCYYTVSRRLADDVTELALKTGFVVSEHIRLPRNENSHQTYELGLTTTQVGWNKNNWSTTDYQGKVWCLTVPSGIFLVKRNGKICWSGNSPQVVDQQRHLITKEALARDLPRFLAHPHYRNANLLHTNIQVGEVLPVWRHPKTGEVFKTKVDDVGLFMVVKVRTDKDRPPVMDEVIRDIKNGKLASFSISADAPFDARRYVCKDGTCFYVIDRIYYYECTLCMRPVNQDAKFTILNKADPLLALANQYRPSSYCVDGQCPIDPLAVYRITAPEQLKLERKYTRLLKAQATGAAPLPNVGRTDSRSLQPYQVTADYKRRPGETDMYFYPDFEDSDSDRDWSRRVQDLQRRTQRHSTLRRASPDPFARQAQQLDGSAEHFHLALKYDLGQTSATDELRLAAHDAQVQPQETQMIPADQKELEHPDTSIPPAVNEADTRPIEKAGYNEPNTPDDEVQMLNAAADPPPVLSSQLQKSEPAPPSFSTATLLSGPTIRKTVQRDSFGRIAAVIEEITEPAPVQPQARTQIIRKSVERDPFGRITGIAEEHLDG